MLMRNGGWMELGGATDGEGHGPGSSDAHWTIVCRVPHPQSLSKVSLGRLHDQMRNDLRPMTIGACYVATHIVRP